MNLKITIKSISGKFNSSFALIILMIFIGSLQCEAQSRKTLTEEEIKGINTLFELNYIGVKNDGWNINPDLWNSFDFTQRKTFTEKLSVYYKNYTDIGKKMSGFCYFYNMATKKKIAEWYKNEYREFE